MNVFRLIWDKFQNFIYKEDGGKNVLNIKKISYCFTAVFFTILSITALKKEDTSYHRRGSTKAAMKSAGAKTNNSQNRKKYAQVDGGFYQGTLIENTNSIRETNKPEIQYKATQVIGADSEIDSSNFIPIGTNFIGQLLTGIDTRDANSMIKVILPYGGSFKGRGKIPKNTLLLGVARYSGKGEKICIKFDRGVTPDGKEFKIEAQALTTKDYSPCIRGEYHSSTGVRVATTLGLTMVSGMTDVLTKKVAIGNNGPFGGSQTVTADSTMKNALLHGTSKVAEMEAKRQAQRLNQEGQEYITLDSGKDLIVSLTRTFKPDF